MAFDHALELPDAELYEFAAGWLAVRVVGKWFLNSTERDGRLLINVKADPVDVAALQQAYESIKPGYHMNKRHWVSIVAGEDINAELVQELIADSYSIVVAGLPKKERPYAAISRANHRSLMPS